MSSPARLFVWLGGVTFVLALGFGVYSYSIRWSVPGDVDLAALGFNVVVFTVFALHHSLFARTRAKNWLAGFVPDRLVRSVYVWIASLLFIAVCGLWKPIGGIVYRHAGWIGTAHALVQFLGVGLIVQSVRAIDPLELAGIRSQSVGGGFQVTGPYRLVRHPLYLGWILAVFGAALMTGDRLAFAALTVLYLVVAVPWEERSLRAAFGSDYERYARRVRWRVIPFIY
jgi:protein-S-isoprenylcysteine O-methyltransferase Ste14